MNLKDLMQIMVNNEASDLYLTTGAPASLRIHGKLTRLDHAVLAPERIKEMAWQIMDDEQKASFQKHPEVNLALSESGVGRFRVNIYKQRNQIAMVVRNIQVDVPSLDQLQLPEIFKQLIMEPRGLFLVAGGSSSGRTTTLAALIDHRNSHGNGHIITLEDPIEFLHKHKNCLVSQREIGVDTASLSDALENSLRQAPDVIMISDIRDGHTLERALALAENGNLVIASIIANNTVHTLERMLGFFSQAEQDSRLMALAVNLKAVAVQRLVPTVDGKRAAAVEVFINNPSYADLIQKGQFAKLMELAEKSPDAGMQTMDQALHKLLRQGVINKEQALAHADSANNLRLRINLEKNQGLSPGAPNETIPTAGPGKPIRYRP